MYCYHTRLIDTCEDNPWQPALVVMYRIRSAGRVRRDHRDNFRNTVFRQVEGMEME